MEILIAGGTGFIGRHLATELVNRGHQVVAMSRDPDGSVVPDAVELREADITSYPAVQDVLVDVDAVIHLVALSPLYRPRGGPQMHERVHVQGTRNLVRAMEAANIDRLIHLSGLGADPDGPTAFLRTKGRAEGIVKSADIDATIFRPAVIFGEGDEFVPFVKLVTTPYLTGLPGGGHTPFQPVWVGDFVEIIADALAEEDHIGNVYDIGGPEPLTLAAVTKAIYRASGRWARIIPIPMVLAGVGLTLAGPIPFIPFGRDQYRSLQLDHTVPDNDIEDFNRRTDELLRFESYLRGDAPEQSDGN